MEIELGPDQFGGDVIEVRVNCTEQGSRIANITSIAERRPSSFTIRPTPRARSSGPTWHRLSEDWFETPEVRRRLLISVVSQTPTPFQRNVVV